MCLAGTPSLHRPGQSCVRCVIPLVPTTTSDPSSAAGRPGGLLFARGSSIGMFLGRARPARTRYRPSPVGDDVDRGDTVLIVCADDEVVARPMLAADPCHDSILTIASVQRWSLWLRSPTLPTLIR